LTSAPTARGYFTFLASPALTPFCISDFMSANALETKKKAGSTTVRNNPFIYV
jgi:hypothetical protein